MRNVVVVAMVVVAVSCGSKGVVGEMEGLVGAMCACKDADCVEAVHKQIEDAGKKYKGKLDSISDADLKKLTELDLKLKECAAKASGSIGAFGKYMSKSKSSEARQFIKKIVDGARAYYMSETVSASSMTPLPPQFPSPSIGPTPPLGECCKQGGKCAASAELWNKPQWIALQFSVDDPHYYSYKYELSDDGKEVTVTAHGDLDCDGVYSTFSMFVVVDDKYSDGPTASPALFKEKELE